MPQRDNYDLVVLGAGAGGLTAACVAASEGLKVLVVEKSNQVGGTTAWSGGMVWAPNNSKIKAAGRSDSPDLAREYLSNVIGDDAGENVRKAFLDQAGSAIDYLECHTPVRFRPVVTYPDYYPDLPGSTAGGRVLEPSPFDATCLGKDFQRLRAPLPEFTLFGGMMISRADIPHFRKVGRSLRATWQVTKLIARYAKERLRAPRGTTLYLGNALVGWLLLAAKNLHVEIVTGTKAVELLVSPDGVNGVRLSGRSGDQIVRAARGVVLATGGFSHDPSLRQQLQLPSEAKYSATTPENTGDGLKMAAAAGAAVGNCPHGGAFWVPVSCFRREDGRSAVFPHTVTDRSKPGIIAIDGAGRRFTNEARSYHEFVLAMLRQARPSGPAWLICDSEFLWRYGLGRIKPFTWRLGPYLADGYLRKASSPAKLAQSIGVDAANLAATIEQYNLGAISGQDAQFNRGGDIYQRHLGDADHRPNPCVAPIQKSPFFAVAVYPGDLGTAVGLKTDEHARVLDRENRPIGALYSCGNDMHSVMNGSYPAPGITLGPALTFGYIAACHAARGGTAT